MKIILSLIFILLLHNVGHCGVEVVSNSNIEGFKPTHITIRSIFFGIITRWEATGKPITVFILPSSSQVTKQFAWNILKVTPHSFEEKINNMIATRDGNPPKIVQSEMEMIKTIVTTPYSIGYLGSLMVITNENNNLRIITIY
jgi:ABC-type phosphate transport system substrate-binding protein